MGFAVGTAGIYRTTNGGVNWNRITNIPYTVRDFYTNNNVLMYALVTHEENGSRTYISKSTNGGTIWSSTYISTAYLYDMVFYDDNHGYAYNTGYLVYTSNAGESWFPVSPLSDIYSVKILEDSGIVKTLVTGYSGKIYQCTNFNHIWEPLNVYPSNLPYTPLNLFC